MFGDYEVEFSPRSLQDAGRIQVPENSLWRWFWIFWGQVRVEIWLLTKGFLREQQFDGRDADNRYVFIASCLPDGKTKKLTVTRIFFYSSLAGEHIEKSKAACEDKP